jgi:vesicle coat complex subunit
MHVSLAVAALVLALPKRQQSRKAEQLVECLWDEDPGIVNRASDALEKVSRRLPSLLDSWKAPLLGLLVEAEQNKLRWNLAVIVPRLKLSLPECRKVAEILQSYLDDSSSIVKTCALQGLASLSRQDTSLGPEVLDLLRLYSLCGTPAMRARGRHLLRQLETPWERLSHSKAERSQYRNEPGRFVLP